MQFTRELLRKKNAKCATEHSNAIDLKKISSSLEIQN